MSDRVESAELTRERPWVSALLGVLLALPAGITYLILWRTAVPIPYMDDYDAILDFANKFSQLHTAAAKLLLINDSVHVQYKLILLHAIVAGNLALFGNVHFVLLQWLGNIFLVLIAWCLWRMMPDEPLQRRMLLFLPVSLFVFVLRDEEALNWSMAGLQQITVMAYAAATFLLFQSRNKFVFTGGIATFLLGIWSSINGFLIFPVALLMFWQQRSRKRLLVLSIVCALAVVSYLHLYYQELPPEPLHTSSPLLIPVFWLTLLGNTLSRLPLALPLGTLLVIIAARKLMRERLIDTAVATVWFLLLNAALTAAGRYKFSLAGAMSSRYCIYSQVLIAVTYILWIRSAPAARLATRERVLPAARGYWTVLVIAILLFVHYERIGARLERERTQASLAHMAAWEHLGPRISLAAIDDPEVQRNARSSLPRVSAILQESIRLGVYTPPALPPVQAPPYSQF